MSKRTIKKKEKKDKREEKRREAVNMRKKLLWVVGGILVY